METRRGFLKKGILGGALLVVGGTAFLAFRRTLRAAKPRNPLLVLSENEYAIFAAVAERVVAVDGDSPSTDAVDVAGRADAVMAQWPDPVQMEFRRVLHLFESALTGALTRTGYETFTASPARMQDARLAVWAGSRVAVFRSGYQAMKRLACACYYAAPESWPATGYPGPPELPFADGE
ncbi:MAG TPA: gluconate 2-dehydrogenase subunit 3 family protein [Thermoanaerobaculia bacterium]|nr:gluconate 2-dehydrogenase subunit 3 family protein [Thermoanaerobaculia bacterium]